MHRSPPDEHPLGRRASAITAAITAAMGAAVVLAACGGGQDTAPPPSAGALAAPLASGQDAASVATTTTPPDKRKLSASADDVKRLLDWAQFKFPELFPGNPPTVGITYQNVDYTVRGYANGHFLGVTTAGDIWGVGAFTNNVLTSFGNVRDFAAQVQADRCQVYAGTCLPPRTSFPRFSIGQEVAIARHSNGAYTLWGDDRALSAIQVLFPGTGIRPLDLQARQVQLGYSVGVIVDPSGKAFGWGGFGWAVGAALNVPIRFEDRVAMAFPGEVIQVETLTGSTTYRTVALLADGTLWSFPGTSSDIRARQPMKVTAPGTLRSLSTPSAVDYRDARNILTTGALLHGLASDGTVWRIPVEPAGSPTAIAGATDVEGVHCAPLNGTLCAGLRRDGTVMAWPVSGLPSPAPAGLQFDRATLVPGLVNVRQAFADGSGVLALADDGKLWTWEPSNPLRPARRANSFEDITDLGCGPAGCVLRRRDGSVWGWGSSNFLEPGRIVFNSMQSPYRIRGLTIP